MQHCEAAYAPKRRQAVFDFQNNQMGSMIPKEIKHNLHYDDVGETSSHAKV